MAEIDMRNTGLVTGRVITDVNGIVGIGAAYVIIWNNNQIIAYMISDPYGNFNFKNIKSSNGRKYTIFASKQPYGYGFSEPFEVESGTEVKKIIMIVIQPARIEMWSERRSVKADGKDAIDVRAYVYDALGNPVKDDINIKFTVKVPRWTINSGSLGLNSSEVKRKIIVPTVNGVAVVKYGWVPKGVPLSVVEIEAKIYDNKNIVGAGIILSKQSINIINDK